MARKPEIPLPEINHPIDLRANAPTTGAGSIGQVATGEAKPKHSGKFRLGQGYEGPVDSPDTPKKPLTEEEVEKHAASLPKNANSIPDDYAHATKLAYLGLAQTGTQPPKKESLWSRIPRAGKIGAVAAAAFVTLGATLGVASALSAKKEETAGPAPSTAPATAGTLGVGEQGNGNSTTLDTEAGIATIQAQPTAEVPATTAQPSAAETSVAASTTTGFLDGKATGDPDGTQPAIPATPTAGAEATGSATAEAIVNPNGTVVMPEALANNPEALGKALVTNFENWTKAGATVDEVKAAYETDPAQSKYANDPNAIYNYPNDVAAENQTAFAGIFIDGWEQHPDLVQEAETWTDNNAHFLGRFNATANQENLEGLTTEGDIYQHLALYDEKFAVLSSSKLPTSQDGTVVISVQFRARGNGPDTNIPNMVPSPGSSDFTFSKTYTLAPQQGQLRIAEIANN